MLAFILVVLVLLIISILLALLSYRNVQKIHEVGKVKDELKKGKVIFQNDSAAPKDG